MGFSRVTDFSKNTTMQKPSPCQHLEVLDLRLMFHGGKVPVANGASILSESVGTLREQ
jgi:hypothetical protein